MKILKLRAENVKRISVVEISPAGHVVQITGPNEAGKTSVLDSIWWALVNVKNVQAAPIRKGASKARIRLDLGSGDKVDCIVTRTFSRAEGGGFSHSLSVENAQGFRAPSPQKMLDGFLDALSFDPLWFKRAPAAQQFEALRRFAPDVDFAGLKKAHDADYARRTEINRDAAQQRAAAAEIAVAADIPAAPLDEDALIRQLEDAGSHNAAVEQRKANRERAAAKVEGNERRIAELQAEIDKLTAETADLKTRLAEAGALPERIDTAAIRAEIDRVKAINAGVAARQRRDAHVAAAERLEAESAALTRQIEDRQARRSAAIAAAALPVPGLTLSDDAVFYDGVPFDQASDAVQLQVSCAVGMAANAALRVMRIRDGSLLDSKHLDLIAKMAAETDYQVWIERVDESGAVGFVMEDGHLKGVQPPPDENQTAQVAAE